jgi:hypothetical protein
MAEADGVAAATRLGASGARLKTSTGADSVIADSSMIEKPCEPDAGANIEGVRG